ncbi:hypothetical protein CASFOL_014729 [Castilleja foliolosa]|uniref:KIB1-4 beta-propeller domain-containing protein n=1 Tax=Castilleja foliolosa TaxID=1961234 RepID=A0ABD3DFQ8_9LAMI
MGSMLKRGCATGFCLLRRISVLRCTRNCGDRKLGARMMSTGVNFTPSSKIVSPWLMLPPLIEDGGDTVYKFYNLSEDKEESFRKKRNNSEEEMDAELVGSSHGWLALFNRRNNNHIFLYNPITRRHIKLPPIETLPDPKINLTPNGRGSISKLILSSSPDDDDEECIAMMIFSRERRLAFCHPCRSTEWTPVGELYYHLPGEGSFPRSYEDIVYSSTQKLLFCQTLMTLTLDLECWDLSNSLSPRIHSSWELCWSQFHSDELVGKYLVKTQVNLVYSEEYNQLFIVMRYVMERMSPDGSFAYPLYFGKSRGWDNRYPYRTIGFDAYKFDVGVKIPQKEEDLYDGLPMFIGINQVQHVEEGSLDGLSMFVGINHSIAMSPTPQLKLNSNCIYYTDPNNLHIRPSAFYGGHDIGIYDYTNRTFSPCYDIPLDVESIKRIMPAPMWFTPCHH